MRVIQFVFTLLLIIPYFTTAWSADIEGSSDHPLAGRFSGSEIVGYHVSPYNEYTLPEGLVANNKTLSKSSELEGKVTRILYMAKKGVSPLEIYKNYEKKLKQDGFKEIFSCKDTRDTGCGYYLLKQATFQPALIEYAYESRGRRYLSMKKADLRGDVYISLMHYIYDAPSLWRHDRAMLQLDVIETKALDDTQIEVITADKISKQVSEQGRIALYGIYFDTNKATLKPESNATLEQIEKSLQTDPKLKLHVVGHSDNTGSFDHNMKLSLDRANAVKLALTKRGIEQNRLTANGVASLAPVTSNVTENGREKNRRVELVAQ